MYYNTDQLSSKDLIDYLSQLVKLETSIYMQQEAKKKALSSLDSEKRKSAPKPPKKQAVIPTHVPVPSKRKPYAGLPRLVFIGCCMLALIIIAVRGKITFSSSGSGIFLIIAEILLFFAFLIQLGEVKKNVKKSKSILKQYEKRVRAASESDEQKRIAAEEQYQQEVEEFDIVYSEYKQKCSDAENIIKKMDQPLDESYQLLDKLYQRDWLFPKYRNMVAVCSIYEYLVTGRCSQLTGADGAYNLYESELRQNLIISKLDTIIKNLEQIKQNQYILYAELQKINRHLEGISIDIKGLMRTTQTMAYNTAGIAIYSHLTAVNTAAIASNTEALKYLTMISG